MDYNNQPRSRFMDSVRKAAVRVAEFAGWLTFVRKDIVDAFLASKQRVPMRTKERVGRKGKLIDLWRFFWNSNYCWGAIVLAGVFVALLTFRISDPLQQESVLAALKDTPIPTILVIGGISFLLLSIAGQLAGRIAVAPERQRRAAVIGGGLLMIGVALHVAPQVNRPSSLPTKDQRPQPSDVLPSLQPPPEPSVQASTEDKEPNDDIATATVISEGTTVRGVIATDQDQDFFKLNPSSYKIRVIVRIRSESSFVLIVIVYDHFEMQLALYPATMVQSATFSFESIPGSVYYIVVKPVRGSARGNYELVVQKE